MTLRYYSCQNFAEIHLINYGILSNYSPNFRSTLDPRGTIAGRGQRVEDMLGDRAYFFRPTGARLTYAAFAAIVSCRCHMRNRHFPGVPIQHDLETGTSRQSSLACRIVGSMIFKSEHAF